jgi:hypothetical protein
VRDEVANVLDYLAEAELILNINPVSVAERVEGARQGTRISWHSHDPKADFLVTRQYGTIEQYLHWVTTGAYSAVLLDASLLQITYDLIGSDVVAHRLAYTPCPFIVDTEFLEEGNPIDEVMGMYVALSDVALRSPIRFDYDLRAAKGNHPAAHLTLNSADCRIACVAPMHVLRFVDFIFRHFYPALWNAHSPFFDAASWRHMGSPIITSEDRTSPHLMWDVRATETGVAAIRRGA